MPTVRAIQTRPSIEVSFYVYDSVYLASLSARHNYRSHMTSSYDGLTRTVEMVFDTVEDLNAWQNDAERKFMSSIVNEYNMQHGITATSEIIS